MNGTHQCDDYPPPEGCRHIRYLSWEETQRIGSRPYFDKSQNQRRREGNKPPTHRPSNPPRGAPTLGTDRPNRWNRGTRLGHPSAQAHQDTQPDTPNSTAAERQTHQAAQPAAPNNPAWDHTYTQTPTNPKAQRHEGRGPKRMARKQKENQDWADWNAQQQQDFEEQERRVRPFDGPGKEEERAKWAELLNLHKRPRENQQQQQTNQDRGRASNDPPEHLISQTGATPKQPPAPCGRSSRPTAAPQAASTATAASKRGGSSRPTTALQAASAATPANPEPPGANTADAHHADSANTPKQR